MESEYSVNPALHQGDGAEAQGNLEGVSIHSITHGLGRLLPQPQLARAHEGGSKLLSPTPDTQISTPSATPTGSPESYYASPAGSECSPPANPGNEGHQKEDDVGKPPYIQTP